jgi:hypothetical protein
MGDFWLQFGFENVVVEPRAAMFFRHKRSGHTEYLQIVKNERVDGKPRQSVVATLGRVDELAQAVPAVLHDQADW